MHLGRLGQVGELVEVMPLAQQFLRGSMADRRQVVRVVGLRRMVALAGICVASLLVSGSGLAQTGKLSLVTGALPPLARVEMFIYLNKKHAALVPKAAQALVEMKTDGSYQKLYDAYLKPLNRQ